MTFRIHWLVFDGGARGVLTKKVIALPVSRWPDGPWHESAPAIRANIADDGVHTSGTKRTFIRTDPRLHGVWR